jgi:hypothetical protein
MIDYKYSEFESDMDDKSAYRGKREKRKRQLMKFRKKFQKEKAKKAKNQE